MAGRLSLCWCCGGSCDRRNEDNGSNHGVAGVTAMVSQKESSVVLGASALGGGEIAARTRCFLQRVKSKFTEPLTSSRRE